MDEQKIEVIRPAFLTGSRVYGKPHPASDWDLVTLVDYEALELLKDAADRLDPDDDGMSKRTDPQGYDASGASLRFGRLNIIAVLDPDLYDAWATGTRELAIMRGRLGRPINRDEAVRYLTRKRKDIGALYAVGTGNLEMIYGPVASLQDCLDYDPGGMDTHPEGPNPDMYIFRFSKDEQPQKIHKYNHEEARWMTPKQKEPKP